MAADFLSRISKKQLAWFSPV